MTAIEVKNLTVSYGEHNVLHDFSLKLDEGEAVLIRGPSGCGKSTLLHTICGLIPAVIEAECSGDVLVFGQAISDMGLKERAQMLGIVFQNPDTQLFCDTVEDEVAFGLENLCVSNEEMSKRIDDMLRLTNMEEFRFASPSELSGGQKQRVVLASTLALEPKVLLLDEAISQLDSRGKQTLIEQFKRLRNEGHSMLMVDHDDELAQIASRIVEIDNA